MFEILDRQTSLTGNQIKILAAAIIGDALEFFDYFLIGFVLAFLIGPWKLTFGQSATVLMSSGIGAILGAYVWGWLADRIGRRKVFICTVLNFSAATGLLYFTPDNGWVYLSVMRFFVGVGVGGLYCVDLPLVQEFMPSSKRGWVGGLVTCVIPLGTGLGAVLGASVGSGDWRLLFAIGVLPAILVLLVRLWVPESPRWLCRQGRYEEARESLAWALQMKPSALPLPTTVDAGPIIKSSWLDLFKYPRSLIVSWFGNAGAQTGVYGITLWVPSLFVLLLKVTPQEAAKMMILLTVFGFVGRVSFSFFSEWMGRRNAGGLLGFGAGVLTIVAGYNYDTMFMGVSAFWLILAVGYFFADGGFAIVGPYAAEVWPSHLRTSGMGSAYGFGGIGKIIGPVGLALIVGSGNYLKPDVPLPQIPLAFIYLGCWFLMAGAVYYFLGIETRGKSIEQIDRELAEIGGHDVHGNTSGPTGIALDTMMTATSADLAGDPAVIALAEAVRPAVGAAASTIESTRRLPPALLDKLHEAGLFRLLLPRSSNGIETDPMTFFHVIETIAQADASTAWCLSQAGGCAMSAAYLDLPVAHAIFGNDPRAVLAWGPGPKVTAIECAGGYKVTGVWSFASGGRHATWLGAHCPITKADGTPRLDANGLQQERTMLVRTEDVQWTDIWNTVGLRGTASDQFALSDYFVRADHSITREFDQECRESGTLYRMGSGTCYQVGFAGVACGIARGALDSFVDVARNKVARGAKNLLRDNAVVQSNLAQAEVNLRAARGFVLQSMADVWKALAAGSLITVEQRVTIRMAATHAIHKAREAVDFAYNTAGATAIFQNHPLERRFRDIHTVTQQLQGRLSHFETVGAWMMGADADLTFV